MKTKLFKLLSVLLSVSMVISVFCMLGTTTALAIDTNYYVISGGSGDGRTAETPAATVADAIASVNADGLIAGDTANIYIMQRADWNEIPGQTVGGGITPQHKMTSWSTTGAVPAHTAYVVVQSNGSSINNLAFCDKLGANVSMVCGGPTVFKNINLVCMRLMERSIVSNGYDLTYETGTYFKYVDADVYGSAKLWNGVINESYCLKTSLGNLASAGDNCAGGTFTYAASCVWGGRGLYISHDEYNGWSIYQNDVTVIYDNAGIKQSIVWGSGHVSSKSEFTKNLNINLKEANTITNYKGIGSVIVDGGLQIITNPTTVVNFNEVYNFSNLTVKGGKWYITNSTGDENLLNFTATAGTYNVKEGYTAVAKNNDDNTVISSVNGVLTIPAGSYTVTSTKLAVVKSYYVRSGATGDGRKVITPAATVADAIASVNADGLIAGDTANIYIMQRADWNEIPVQTVGGGNTPQHKMTSWSTTGAVPAHTASIVVQSYGSSINNLAFCDKLGANVSMVCGGPTVFKNINLVCMRLMERSIVSNGYDLTYETGTYFKNVDADVYGSAKLWNGVINESYCLKTSLGNFASASGNCIGGTFTYAAFCAWGGRGLYISHDEYNGWTTYQKDVTVIYDNAGIKQSIVWGSGHVSSKSEFTKNLNINLKEANTITNYKGIGSVIVDGGLQIITNPTTVVNFNEVYNFSNLTVKGGKWYITNNTSDENLLNFTATAGIYNVKEGYTAIAKNNDDNTVISSVNGVLTIPAGSYTVTSQKIPETRNYYVINGGTGDGSTENAPAASVSDVIVSVNADGLIAGDTANIYIMQRADWNSATDVYVGGDSLLTPPHNITYWKENGGTIPTHTATIVVQSYGEAKNYLANSDKLGLASGLACGGPTVFRNIYIVSTRNTQNSIYTNGYDLTYDVGTSFGGLEVDMYWGSHLWSGTVEDVICLNTSFGSVSDKDYCTGGTLTYNTDCIYANRGIWISDREYSGTSTFENDASIVFENSGIKQSINWGSGNQYSWTRFNKNLNINIKAANTISMLKGLASVTIDGGLQIITNPDTIYTGDIKSFSNVTIAGGYWYIINNYGVADILNFTEKTGTYSVKDGCTVAAINLDTNEYTISSNGKLSIGAGKYSIIDYSDPVLSDGKTDIRDLLRLKEYLLVENSINIGSQADYNLDEVINLLDLVTLKQILLGVKQINKTMCTQSGGASSEAKTLRTNILNSSDNLIVTGTAYYISNYGDDSDTGLTPATAWKTLNKFHQMGNFLKPGDAVLFERGSTFRMSEDIDLVSGVSYGAYGTGDKPLLIGSECNYAQAALWSTTESENVWVTTMPTSSFVGNIVFNLDESTGWMKEYLYDVQFNGNYYFDSTTGKLYLYSSFGNPGDVYDDIEVCVRNSFFSGAGVDNVKIDNISMKYTGSSGIDFTGGNNSNITITNCEIAWAGGSYLGDGSQKLRGGNGISFWDSLSYATITNNWIYQIYDAGISPQGDADNMLVENIAVTGNLIEYCTWSYEQWVGNNNGTMRNNAITNNIMRFAGYGWSDKQRANNEYDSHFNAWAYHLSNCFDNYQVKNNIFDCSAKALVAWHWETADVSHDGLVVSNNTYYQKTNKDGLAMWYGFSDNYYGAQAFANSQTELEVAVAAFDGNPAKVEFLG